MTAKRRLKPPLAVNVGELMENLRAPAWMFEKEKDGRFSGSVAACRAVTLFISQRGCGAVLAAPFLHIAAALIDREHGGDPSLFRKKSARYKERSRSPERKHLQRLAATSLEVFVFLEDDLMASAKKVARAVNHWKGMQAQQVTFKTVIAWRKRPQCAKFIQSDRRVVY